MNSYFKRKSNSNKKKEEQLILQDFESKNLKLQEFSNEIKGQNNRTGSRKGKRNSPNHTVVVLAIKLCLCQKHRLHMDLKTNM